MPTLTQFKGLDQLTALGIALGALSSGCVSEPLASPSGEVEVTISPQVVTLAPGEHVLYEAVFQGADLNNTRANLVASLGAAYSGSGPAVSWSATGGIISAEGAYAASEIPGEYFVIATLQNLADTGRVIVSGEPLAPVASIVIEPDAALLAPGGQVQLQAVLRDEDGTELANRSVAWSAEDPATASVSPSGLVSAHDVGTTTVRASSGGVTGVADISVSEASAASIEVSPSQATLDPQQTVKLEARVYDGSGNEISAPAIDWSSDDESVATVQSDGLVTAVNAGQATIAATSGSVSDAAVITVQSAAQGLAGECDRAQQAWIWCDDFERDRLQSYFEYSDGGGRFTRAAGVGVEGSSGMLTQFGVGDVSVGSLHLAFGKTPDPYFQPVDAGTAKYRELYWRFYLKHQPGWVGGGGDKLSRATVFARSNWAQAMIAHVWSGSRADNEAHLIIEPASGTNAQGALITTTYNDFANLRWMGGRRSQTPLFDAGHVGRWYCVETHVRLNDSGQANGEFALWIDGALEAKRDGLDWLGSFGEYGLNAVFLENHWSSGGSPVAQERYFDNFVVSTQPIGCLAADAPPGGDEPVASMSVVPSSLVMAVNGTAPLQAEPRDQHGNRLFGRAVHWTSSAPAVARVSPSGSVTAVAPGTAQITAESEGSIGTASVVVTAQPPPPNGGPHPNEPAGYTRFVEHAFDGIPHGGHGGGGGIGSFSAAPYNLSIVTDPTAPESPSNVLRFLYPAGHAGGTGPTAYNAWDDLNNTVNPASEAVEYSEVYISLRLKFGDDWGFPTHGVLNKIFLLGVGDPPAVAINNAVVSFVAYDPSVPVGQQTYYHGQVVQQFTPAFQLQGLGNEPFRGVNEAVVPIVTGKWMHHEVVMKVNTIGQANGVFSYWIDGVRTMHYTNVLYRAASKPHGFQHYHQNPVWGGLGGTMPRDAHFYEDHLYISGIRQK